MQAEINYLVANVISNCQQSHGQAVYIWDVEGHQFGGWTYIGHPSLLPQVAPEMNAVIDSAIASIQAAGLDVAFTLRPQKLMAASIPPSTCMSANTTNSTYSSGTTYSKGDVVIASPSVTWGTGTSTYISVSDGNTGNSVGDTSWWWNVDYWNDTLIDTSKINTYPTDTTSNLYCSYTNTWSPWGQAQIMQTQQKSLSAVQAVLQADITYAHTRWGNRVRFYVDSTTFQFAYDTSLWNALVSANPGVYFSPEESIVSYYSVAFPYVVDDSLSASDRALNPKYFGLVAMGSDSAAVVGIAAGDISRVNSTWYTNSDALQQLANRTAAIVINSSMTVTDTGTSTQHTYTGTPGTILSYPVVMRRYFAASSGALPASTTYCEQKGAAACYQAGVPTGGATVDLTGLPVSELRYYDFAGNQVLAGSGTRFLSGRSSLSGRTQ
jgi:hypothetical protein